MHEKFKISVLTVTHGRKECVEKFMESIVHADKFDVVEVLVLINGIDRSTKDVLEHYAWLYSNISIITGNSRDRGETRNVLIQHAQSEILYFIDDDVIIKKNSFAVLLDRFEKYKDIHIIGGPNLSPRHSTLFQTCQGYVLSSFFGTLWMSQRYHCNGFDRIASEQALILCNLAIKRRVFDETGVLFNHHLSCAEENLLLENLVRRGYSAMYIPELVVYHERRKTYLAFCKQIYTYGRGRCQIIKYLSNSIHFVHFIPSIFFIYTLLLFLNVPPLFYIPLIIYIMLILLYSLRIIIRNRKVETFFMVSILYPTVHLAYGIGFFIELTRWLKNIFEINETEKIRDTVCVEGGKE